MQELTVKNARFDGMAVGLQIDGPIMSGNIEMEINGPGMAVYQSETGTIARTKIKVRGRRTKA
ncbi:MAG TPA: hypothetical protein VIJ62_02200 [Rhizomicrobium sp.]